MLSDGNNKEDPFIITVSARVLFDMEESHEIYESQGLEAFEEHQREREHVPLKPGPAFNLVRKFLAFNENRPEGVRPFEVVLLSRNSSDTALRVLNTIEALKLPLIRAVFTGGAPSSTYIEAIGAHLFLSSNPEEVGKVVNECGIAGATIMASKSGEAFPSHETEIRIAFDGDAVLFSDEAERVYGQSGLAGFQDHEHQHASRPLEGGPFKSMLEAVHTIQQAYGKNRGPIRTALVTARSMPAHMRALNTLRSWGVTMDEVMLLGGKPKGAYLKAFKADFFVDDSQQNIDSALNAGALSGHVPYGTRNQPRTEGVKFSGDEVVGEAITVNVVPQAANSEPSAPRRKAAGPGR